MPVEAATIQHFLLSLSASATESCVVVSCGVSGLRLGYWKFVNRRSSVQSGSPAPLFFPHGMPPFSSVENSEKARRVAQTLPQPLRVYAILPCPKLSFDLKVELLGDCLIGCISNGKIVLGMTPLYRCTTDHPRRGIQHEPGW